VKAFKHETRSKGSNAAFSLGRGSFTVPVGNALSSYVNTEHRRYLGTGITLGETGGDKVKAEVMKMTHITMARELMFPRAKGLDTRSYFSTANAFTDFARELLDGEVEVADVGTKMIDRIGKKV